MKREAADLLSEFEAAELRAFEEGSAKAMFYSCPVCGAFSAFEARVFSSR